MDGDITRMFIEKHKDSIVCEPSGWTYEQVLEDRVQKVQLINGFNKPISLFSELQDP